MNNPKEPPKQLSESATSKKKYEKPAIRSESLTAVAAVCNGSTAGQRKASTGAPANCNAARLKS
jgi:hypothetical protein